MYDGLQLQKNKKSVEIKINQSNEDYQTNELNECREFAAT